MKRRRRKESKLSDDKDALLAKVESLKEQVGTLEEQERLQLERDVLEVTAEIMKKRAGRRSEKADQPGKGNSDRRPEGETPPEFSLIVWNNDRLSRTPKALLIVGLCLAATPGDGSFFAVLEILAFGAYRGDFKRQARAYCAIVAGALLLFRGFLVLFQFGMFLIIPLLRQYNGTLGGSKHSKWFFYVFYPLHLLVLGLLKYGT